MITPNIEDSRIIAFCDSIVRGQKPMYVQHRPLLNKPVKECFSIVPEHVASRGGKQIFGWAIFEIPGVWLEAEFHVIWKRLDGTLFDVTPRTIPMDSILFLPDPERNYEGFQVQSIINPLNNSPALLRLIELTSEFFRETNKGDLAYQNEFIYTPRIVAIKQEMEQLSSVIEKLSTEYLLRVSN